MPGFRVDLAGEPEGFAGGTLSPSAWLANMTDTEHKVWETRASMGDRSCHCWGSQGTCDLAG